MSEHAGLTFAAYLVDSGETEETRAILNGIDAERIASDNGLAIAFWQTTCKLHALQGDGTGAREAAERICAIDEHPADAPVLIEGLAEAGISAQAVGETAVARRCLGRAIDVCVALNLTASRGDVLVESALERVLSGAYEEARTLLNAALPMIGEGQLGSHRAVLAALAVGIALDDRDLLGHEPDAAYIDRVFRNGSTARVRAARRAVLAVARESRRTRGGASALAARREDGMRRAAAVRDLPLVIVAAQHCEAGDAADIRKLCAITAANGPVSAHAAELAEAILLQRFGDLALANGMALRASVGFAVIGWPFYEALVLECAGDRAAAQRLLASIGYRGKLSSFEAVTGASLEPALTTRESEIAAHVASGRTNREIAAALSVSIKLVEKNLSSIYAKLAITSRSQLTAPYDRP